MDYEIRDIVELQSHMDMEELFHQDSKVKLEQQMKRKIYTKNQIQSTTPPRMRCLQLILT